MEALLLRQRERMEQAIKEHGPRNGWVKQDAVEIFTLDGEECWYTKNPMWDEFDRLKEEEDFKFRDLLAAGYNGYVCFKQKPIIEPDFRGILTYIPVHGGITYAHHDEIGSVYGYDSTHYDSGQFPIRDIEWTKKQILLMVLGIKMAARIEPEYLAADGDNQRRAELVQPLVELGDGLNFGTMLNLLCGEL
jgi:hypothetical protein